MSPVRYACTNLAWSDDEEAQALSLLRAHGVQGIEVAPTRLWPGWQGATTAAARTAAARWRSEGFEVPALQAILFGRPEARLFGDDAGAAFESHLCRVACLAQALGAGVCVLGAPRNRARGALGLAQATEHALQVLSRLAAVFHDCGVVLGIEPARPEYGGDFLTDHRAVLEFVRLVAHPGLAVHADAAALHSAGETIEDVWAACDEGRALVHYHASEPGLAGFDRASAPQVHNLRFLAAVHWPGWRSFEMLRPTAGFATAGPWSVLDAARAKATP